LREHTEHTYTEFITHTMKKECNKDSDTYSMAITYSSIFTLFQDEPSVLNRCDQDFK